MRILTNKTWMLAAAAMLLLTVAVGSPSAQKIKVRDSGGSTSTVTVNPGEDAGVRVDINAGDGDSIAHVVIRKHGRTVADGDTNSIVRMGEDITISEGQVVPGDVVAIGGSILVLGRVKGDAVSIGGSVNLKGDGVVEKDAVSIGGSVNRESGSKIGGQNVGMRFIPSFIPFSFSRHHDGGNHSVAAMMIILVVLIILFFIGWLLFSVAEDRMRSMGSFVEGHLWQSLLTGLAVLIVFPLAFVLLLITVVGIPLALLSPLAIGLGHIIGFLVVASLVGLRLARSSGTDRGSYFKGMISGLLFFGGIPLIGYLLRSTGGPLNVLGLAVVVFGFGASHVAASIGLGAVVLSKLGQRHRTPEIPTPGPVPMASEA